MKRIICIVLALIMILPTCVAFSVVSGAETEASLATNLFKGLKTMEGYISSAGTVTASTAIYRTEKIAVAPGDTIYAGPLITSSTTNGIVAFDEKDALIDFKAAKDISKCFYLDRTSSMVCEYKVPEGVSYLIINFALVCSPYFVITKNQKIDRFDYDAICAANVEDGDNLYNPYSSLTGAYPATNGGKTDDWRMNCTQTVPVKAGDKVYVGPLHSAQTPAPLGISYTADKQVKSHLFKSSFEIYYSITDNVHMYCYTVPEGVSYVRFVPRNCLTDYIYVSKNKAIEKEDFLKLNDIELIKANTESPLYGKAALFIGDSITFGQGETKSVYFGWAGRIGAMTGMNIVNAGDNAARVSQTGSGGYIIEGLSQAPDGVDMIVVHGGVNDASGNVTLGSVTPEGTKSFNTSTFAGGLEAIFSKARRRYPDAKLFYIANVKVSRDNGVGYAYGTKIAKLYNVAKQICEKWDVIYIDLYGNDELNEKLAFPTTKYMPDNLHPNTSAYNIITPYILEVLEAAYTETPPETVPETEPETAPVTEPTTDSAPDDPIVDTVPSTDPVNNTTTVEPQKKSCGGFGGAMAVLAVGITAFGAAITVIKKK